MYDLSHSWSMFCTYYKFQYFINICYSLCIIYSWSNESNVRNISSEFNSNKKNWNMYRVGGYKGPIWISVTILMYLLYIISKIYSKLLIIKKCFFYFNVPFFPWWWRDSQSANRYEIIARFYIKWTFIQQDFIVYDLDLIFWKKYLSTELE